MEKRRRPIAVSAHFHDADDRYELDDRDKEDIESDVLADGQDDDYGETRKKSSGQLSRVYYIVFFGLLISLFLYFNTSASSQSINHQESGSSIDSSSSIRNELSLALSGGIDRQEGETEGDIEAAGDVKVGHIETSEEEKEDVSNEEEEVEEEDEEALSAKVDILSTSVRMMKEAGKVLETDPEALAETKKLQQAARKLVLARYGPEPYLVELKLTFPSSMPDYDQNGPDGRLLLQLGPLEYVPYSTYMFLEIVRNMKSGAFHRRAGHVLQALVRGYSKSLAFQEYSPHFPHKKHTFGYAGRPGGPEFYISLVDNTENHGPGSQGSKTEADSCFAALKEGVEVVQRMKLQPGATGGSGFVDKRENFIQITSARVVKL